MVEALKSASNSKFPSMSVIVPEVVPFNKIEHPIKGSSLSLSKTVPLISLV